MSDPNPERDLTDTDTVRTPCPSATSAAVSVSQAALQPVAVSKPAPQLPASSKTPLPSQSQESAASVIASLRNVALEEVEAALVATREAYKRGEVAAIEAALIDQFAMLQTLGIKLLRLSGGAKSLPQIQLYGNLGLRAVDSARRSLEALRRLIPPAGRSDAPQTK